MPCSPGASAGLYTGFRTQGRGFWGPDRDLPDFVGLWEQGEAAELAPFGAQAAFFLVLEALRLTETGPVRENGRFGGQLVWFWGTDAAIFP